MMGTSLAPVFKLCNNKINVNVHHGYTFKKIQKEMKETST